MLEPRLILVNLLIKLGVAAAVSSALVRSKEFKTSIFREQRTTRHKIYLEFPPMSISLSIVQVCCQ